MQKSCDTESLEKKTPVVFRWPGLGETVYVSGSYDGWKEKIPLTKRLFIIHLLGLSLSLLCKLSFSCIMIAIRLVIVMTDITIMGIQHIQYN